jgi:hypothetical protein
MAQPENQEGIACMGMCALLNMPASAFECDLLPPCPPSLFLIFGFRHVAFASAE